jgi:cytochrome c oxidase assembly protein subunit 15
MAGGLVTSTGAGLTVPDWPTTFGEHLFLFPWSRMVGGVLVEHSHRLLGAGVGLLTVACGLAVWLEDRRGWLRTLAAAAVGLVGVQGLLGGLRVVLVRDVLALLHGCLAQAFFAVLVALVVETGPARSAGTGWERGERSGPGLAWLATIVTLVVYGQIVLGAFTTHEGWVLTHLGGAVVAVIGIAVLAGSALGVPDPAFTGAGRLLGILVVVQVALGLGAYLARFTDVAVPGGQSMVIALPVLHRAVAAGLLGASVAIAVRAWRSRLARAGDERTQVGEQLTPSRVPA